VSLQKDIIDATSACIPLFGLYTAVPNQMRSQRTEAAMQATRSKLTGY
jgi:hypothetical protein